MPVGIDDLCHAWNYANVFGDNVELGTIRGIILVRSKSRRSEVRSWRVLYNKPHTLRRVETLPASCATQREHVKNETTCQGEHWYPEKR